MGEMSKTTRRIFWIAEVITIIVSALMIDIDAGVTIIGIIVGVIIPLILMMDSSVKSLRKDKKRLIQGIKKLKKEIDEE